MVSFKHMIKVFNNGCQNNSQIKLLQISTHHFIKRADPGTLVEKRPLIFLIKVPLTCQIFTGKH